MSSSAEAFQDFDDPSKKPKDKIKIISIVVNVVLLILIIGLAVGIGVRGKTKKIIGKAPATEVNKDHLLPITGMYYPDVQLRGAAARQHKNDIINSPYYSMTDYYNLKSNDHLHILSNFRTYQQTSDYTCGCACVLMCMDYTAHDTSLSEAKCSELADIGTDIHTSKEGNEGAYPYNLNKVLQMYNYDFESNNGTSYLPFEDNYLSFRQWAIESIDNGWPIIVISNDLGGHYTIIIGIDTMGTDSTTEDTIIMADPYDITDHRQDGYNTWGLERFYDLWKVPVTLLTGIETTRQYIQVKGKLSK